MPCGVHADRHRIRFAQVSHFHRQAQKTNALGFLNRRGFLSRLMVVLTAGVGSSPVSAVGYGLPKVQNLQIALQKAQAKSMPLVVMVTLEGCPYCKVVRQNYLPEYLDKGVPILELDLNSGETIRGETGVATTAREWAKAKGIRIAPTLLWLGENGQELVGRLTGMSSADFYGAYLDDRMNQATQRAKSGH